MFLRKLLYPFFSRELELLQKEMPYKTVQKLLEFAISNISLQLYSCWHGRKKISCHKAGI